ncbi:hypothetical protein DDE82_008596 [Stemphylium lycopersici]|nr:hypothetical protein DDE82_008596 [Stemphylium lycopersici]
MTEIKADHDAAACAHSLSNPRIARITEVTSAPTLAKTRSPTLRIDDAPAVVDAGGSGKSTPYQHAYEAVAWTAQLPQRTKTSTQFHLKPLPLPQTPSPPTPPTTPPLLPKSEPEPESEFKMSDAAKDLTGTAGNAAGGRGLPDVGETMGSVSKPKGSDKGKEKDKGQGGKQEGGFGLDNDTDVKGSLKVHIKLDVEADIRIIARVKGDIAIGIL